MARGSRFGRARFAAGVAAGVLAATSSVGCSGETDTSVQARIEAYYRSPPNEVRAGCLAAAIVRLANESEVELGPLADNLTRASSGTDPTLDQVQARVVADALISCPLPPADGSTTTTAPAGQAPTAPTPTDPSSTDPTSTNPAATPTSVP